MLLSRCKLQPSMGHKLSTVSLQSMHHLLPCSHSQKSYQLQRDLLFGTESIFHTYPLCHVEKQFTFFLGVDLDINEPPFPLLLTQFYICFFHRSLTHPMIGLQYNYCLPPKGSSQKTNKLSRVTFQLFIGNSHEDFCFKVHSLSASCKIFLTNFPDLVPCRVRHINLFLPF